MALQDRFSSAPKFNRLASAAADLGYEIVDIAGFLDLVEEHAQAQTQGLKVLRGRAKDMEQANADVREAVKEMAGSTTQTAQDVESSAALVRTTGEKTRNVANWVQDVSSRTQQVSVTLAAVKTNNQQIATIANQVNTLAINAKIEAARAGDAGRGFAVVAEAINDLSQQTRSAAIQISDNIQSLTDWISTLGHEAEKVASAASEILKNAGGADAALGRMEASITSASEQAQRIARQSDRVDSAIDALKPALSSIDNAVMSTASGIEQTHRRILKLIDTSELIVQSTALLDDNAPDARFIHAVRDFARQASEKLEAAVDSGHTTMSRLFDRQYQVIPGSDPEQFLTEATAVMDQILPAIQEPALDIDPKVVFCAAVDVNGYLPTHKKKFSQPPTNVPVWNTAHCRNRRIFNDRVGLKAGRNTESFLLQVYRRDMGGGEFKMMKDLSAPIFIKGQHWGGLRLAYSIS